MQPDAVSDVSGFYNYFPLDTGSYIVYHVDSIIHEFADDLTNNPDSLKTFYHYEVKEVIDSTFIDGEGDKAFRISRYYRDTVTSPWSFTALWTAKVTNQSAQRVEENLRYVKLSFPVKENKSWNGNLFNYLSEEDYMYEEVDAPLSIGGFNFGSSLTVLQMEDFNLIHQILKKEKYVYGVGLAYRERDSLNVVVVQNITYVTNGVEFRQSMIDYSPK